MLGGNRSTDLEIANLLNAATKGHLGPMVRIPPPASSSAMTYAAFPSHFSSPPRSCDQSPGSRRRNRVAFNVLIKRAH